ncbi:MAG TPA: glycosyltransferase family 39 protein, partial [Chloroflexota bacterium]
MPTWTISALALLVLVPAAGTAMWRGFDGLYGQDAYAYYDYATGPLRSALIHAEPWPPFFWPPGYPLLVALASFVFGSTPVAGQIVSLVMGALVPVFTALLARELWPGQRWLPLLVGGLVALTGQLWQSSMVVMADTTGLAMATLAAFAIARYAHQRRLAWLLVATLAITLALLSRWIYGLVALPLAASLLTSRPPMRHVTLCTVLAVVVLTPVLGPSLLGLVREPTAEAVFAGNLQVYTWSPLNAFLRDFDTPDGHLSYA